MSPKNGSQSGSHTIDAMSSGAKIAAGLALFIVCSIIQRMGDSSMFDPTYLDPGGIRGMLVVVTFYPGWVLIGGFIGTGLYEIFGTEDDAHGPDERPYQAVEGGSTLRPTAGVSDGAMPRLETALTATETSADDETRAEATPLEGHPTAKTRHTPALHFEPNTGDLRGRVGDWEVTIGVLDTRFVRAGGSDEVQIDHSTLMSVEVGDGPSHSWLLLWELGREDPVEFRVDVAAGSQMREIATTLRSRALTDQPNAAPVAEGLVPDLLTGRLYGHLGDWTMMVDSESLLLARGRGKADDVQIAMAELTAVSVDEDPDNDEVWLQLWREGSPEPQEVAWPLEDRAQVYEIAATLQTEFGLDGTPEG